MITVLVLLWQVVWWMTLLGLFYVVIVGINMVVLLGVYGLAHWATRATRP